MASLDHVFVLMLENRSFDHLFGFSGLTGTDAVTGANTTIDGLSGDESNTLQGHVYSVQRGADWAMPVDPGHEFPNVLDQLCGPGIPYSTPYPAINRSGFVDSYSRSGGGTQPGEIMRCFDTQRQLPVLHALAQEYAICDHWFSSLPGPTWPNRMFAHAASSGGLDHSPSTSDILLWEAVDGFSFSKGTIFGALKSCGRSYHLYSGDDFPMVAALKGIELADVHRIDDLVSDLVTKRPFPYDYVFIEPSYNVLHDYRNSTSMHPLADIRDGENLIKKVYEALRASEAWSTSLLIVTWDEHGGFYDHVAPPAATAPGDTSPGSKYNQYRFTFEQYGVRVPALVISPFIAKGTIDHRLYDHSSVLATLEAAFAMKPLTSRDDRANGLFSLLTLNDPRTTDEQARKVLPPALPPPMLTSPAVPPPDATIAPDLAIARENDSVNDTTLPAILHSAMRQDILMSPGRKNEIIEQVARLNTRADAKAYLADVQRRLRAR